MLSPFFVWKFADNCKISVFCFENTNTQASVCFFTYTYRSCCLLLISQQAAIYISLKNERAISLRAGESRKKELG